MEHFFLEHQEIGFEPSSMTKARIEVRSSLFPAQSAYEKTVR